MRLRWPGDVEEGQIRTLSASVPRARAAVEDLAQGIASRRAEQKAAISEEISKRRIELTSLKETLSAGCDGVMRTGLRAHVRGTIKQIFISTSGGVVRPSDSIMDLVLPYDTLLVNETEASSPFLPRP